MASQVLRTISRDEEERARIMRDEKILLDYYSGISYMKKKGLTEGIQIGTEIGNKEGRKEGHKEGRKEGRKERDMELIALWKSGMSPEEILRNLEVSG